jgi:hypothetical protein
VFESLEKANHEVLEALVAKLAWLVRLGVKKYWLDAPAAIWYNNILDSQESDNRQSNK